MSTRIWPAQAPPAENPPGSPPPGWQTTDLIRYLLARRLTRANRWQEAVPYSPPNLAASFEELCRHLNDTRNLALPPEQRAQAYFKAAKITRKSGLELLGTELAPDWRIHAGDFEDGVTVRDRLNLMVTNHLASTPDEIQRGQRHGVDPELRWHYRYVAGALAGKGARLMRDAEMNALSKEQRAKALFEAAADIHFLDAYAMEIKFEPAKNEPALLEPYPSAILGWKAAQFLPNNSDETARILCIAGSWIKSLDPQAADIFYKALVRRCRKTAIGAEADRLRWFPKLDPKGNLQPTPPEPDPF